MKIQLEKIEPENDTSFRWLINPKLNDFFFWHFHPELELVLIEADEGTRHVGEHISRFHKHDLVLIGSNIPHLNFDYGIKTAYKKIVLHINPSFFEHSIINLPELKTFQSLLEKANFGVAFGEKTKFEVNDFFKTIHELNHFEQFIAILRLLKTLAESTDFELLHKEIPKNQLNKKEKERLKIVFQLIDENFQRKIEIEEAAALSNLSKPAFCRYFKKMTKLTFTEFLNHYRINEAKRLLRLDKNVTETCFECGFESLSYFNRIFKKITGENPMAFKKRF
jgi:AraC-like DNA-binding protein